MEAECMTDRVSALDGHMKRGVYGAAGTPGVIVEEVHLAMLFQLATWPETHLKAGKIMAKFVEVHGVPGPGGVKTSEKGELLSIDPTKWWVISDQEKLTIPSVPIKTGVSLDLSNTRTWLRIRGAKADLLLGHFLPLDFRKNKFLKDHVASTGFHHIGVTVWRAKDGFNLLLPRSFALALWELLEACAHQYGLEVV